MPRRSKPSHIKYIESLPEAAQIEVLQHLAEKYNAPIKIQHKVEVSYVNSTASEKDKKA